MKGHRTRPAVVVALLAGLSAVPSGMAQRPAGLPQLERPSHVPLPGEPVTPATADEFLRQRLLQAEMAGDLQQLAGEILRDPEKYRLQAEQLRGMLRGQPDLGRPELRQAVERILEQQARQEKDPEKAARWKEALRRLAESGGTGTGTGTAPGGLESPPTGDEPETMRLPPRDPPQLPKPPVRPGAGPGPSPGAAEPGATPSGSTPSGGTPPGDGTSDGRPAGGAGSTASAETIRQLQELAGRLKGTPLEQSQAVRQMLTDLDRVPRAAPGSRFDWSGPRQKLREQMGGWQTRTGVSDVLPRLGLAPLGNWKWPGGGPGGGGRSLFSPGDVGVGPREDWDSLGLLVGGFGCAILGWAAWQWYQRRAAAALAGGRAVSSWPMPLERLHSRSDVIAAFEHLALTRLGAGARAAHHHAIAEDLGRESNEQAVAAGRLAEIYEQARYAPGEEPLSDEVLREARRHLGRLAEASA